MHSGAQRILCVDVEVSEAADASDEDRIFPTIRARWPRLALVVTAACAVAALLAVLVRGVPMKQFVASKEAAILLQETPSWTRIAKCVNQTSKNRSDFDDEEIVKLAMNASQVKICTLGNSTDCVTSVANSFPIMNLRRRLGISGPTVGSSSTEGGCDVVCVRKTWTGPRLDHLWSNGRAKQQMALSGGDPFYRTFGNPIGIQLWIGNKGGGCGWSSATSGNLEVFINARTKPASPGLSTNLGFSIPTVLPPGAVNGSSKPFPQIVTATFGYNLYYADPSPPYRPSVKVMMDAGMRYPVFALEYTSGRLSSDMRHTLPDGYRATVDTGCATVFTTKSIRDSYELAVEGSKDTSLTTGVEVAAGVSLDFPKPGSGPNGEDTKYGANVGAAVHAGISGTLSYSQSAAREQNEFRESRMMRSVAICGSYVVAIDYVNFPKTHPAFQAAVNELKGNEQKYWDVFDQFGTHFLTTVQMGARYTVSSYMRNDEYNMASTKMEGFGVTVGAAVGFLAGITVRTGPLETGLETNVGASAGNFAGTLEEEVELLSPEEKTAAEQIEIYIKKQQSSSVGAKMPKGGVNAWLQAVGQTPVPIKFDTREICSHPAFATSADAISTCKTYLSSYCRGRLQSKGAICNTDGKRECTYDLECKEDSYCSNYKCLPVPVCKVTLCEDPLPQCGKTYTLPPITYDGAAMGRQFNLVSDHWSDRVSALVLTNGCMKVEAVDDDDICDLGKTDNGIFSANTDLPYDLDNDVCKLMLWAKRPQRMNRRLLALNLSFEGKILENEILGLTEINTRLAARWHHRQALKSLHGATVRDALGLERATHVVGGDAMQATKAHILQAFPTAAIDVGGDAETEARRLQANVTYVTVSGKSYIKNIGKAMYGYNNFKAAPLSVYNAGSDPGFVHRPLWKTQYQQGLVAQIAEFTEMPQADPSYNAPPGEDLIVTIGWSYWATKCIPVSTPDVICSKNAANIGRRINPDSPGAQDSFVISVVTRPDQSTEVCAKRVDVEEAWNMNLQIKCKIVTPPSKDITVSIGSWWDTLKCILTPSPKVRCDPAAGNSGRRTNPDAAGTDTFVITSNATHVCARRTDKLQGWTMKLQFKCKVVDTATLARRLIDSTARRLIAGPPRHLGAGRVPPPAILVPDGWNVTMGRSTYCESDFFSKEVKSEYEYENEQKWSFEIPQINVGGGIGPVAVGLSFSMSQESEEFAKNNNNQKKKMITTKAECIDYIVQIRDLQKAPPPVDDSFKYVVNTVKAEAEYYALFGMFGLYFPTKLVFGARYGYTRYLDNMSYTAIEKNSEGFTVTTAVSAGAGAGFTKGFGTVGAEATATVESSRSEASSISISKTVNKYSKEVHEFSIGKKLPGKGGAYAWTQLVAEEPMPIKYALASICEHPAFLSADKKADCLKYSSTFCEKYLARYTAGVDCKPAAEIQCLWDLDCDQDGNVCREGACVAPPTCTVAVYSEQKYKGQSRTFGPIYWRDFPVGIVFDLRGFSVRSAFFSGGCEEVVFMDEDRCMETYEDNMVLDSRGNNNPQFVPGFLSDLDQDICKVKALVKKEWVETK